MNLSQMLKLKVDDRPSVIGAMPKDQVLELEREIRAALKPERGNISPLLFTLSGGLFILAAVTSRPHLGAAAGALLLAGWINFLGCAAWGRHQPGMRWMLESIEDTLRHHDVMEKEQARHEAEMRKISDEFRVATRSELEPPGTETRETYWGHGALGQRVRKL